MANNNYIPIIARELLPDLAELVLGSGSADFSKLELALDNLKECGFNTFIAEIPYGNISTLLPGVTPYVISHQAPGSYSPDSVST